MPNRREVMSRRKAFFKRHLLGQDHPSIIAALQPKYGGSAATYYSDWSRRKEWLPDLIRAGDAETWSSELIAELHETRAWLWRIAVNSEIQDAVRLGAFKLLQDSIMREIEVLQSSGILPKMAEKLEQKNGAIEERRIILEVSESDQACLERAQRILDKHIKRKRSLH